MQLCRRIAGGSVRQNTRHTTRRRADPGVAEQFARRGAPNLTAPFDHTGEVQRQVRWSKYIRQRQRHAGERIARLKRAIGPRVPSRAQFDLAVCETGLRNVDCILRNHDARGFTQGKLRRILYIDLQLLHRTGPTLGRATALHAEIQCERRAGRTQRQLVRFRRAGRTRRHCLKLKSGGREPGEIETHGPARIQRFIHVRIQLEPVDAQRSCIEAATVRLAIDRQLRPAAREFELTCQLTARIRQHVIERCDIERHDCIELVTVLAAHFHIALARLQ